MIFLTYLEVARAAKLPTVEQKPRQEETMRRNTETLHGFHPVSQEYEQLVRVSGTVAGFWFSNPAAGISPQSVYNLN